MGISLVNPLQDPYWAEIFFDIPSIKVAVNKKVFNICFKMENILNVYQIRSNCFAMGPNGKSSIVLHLDK